MNLATEVSPLLDSSLNSNEIEQTNSSCGIWECMTSWGRKIKPVLIPLTLGVAATASVIASTVFLVQKHQRPETDSTTDHVFEAICWSNLGVSSRCLLEILSSQNKAFYRRIQQLHNSTTGLAFWGFLALWNASLNVDQSQQKDLHGAISAWFGYNLSNDCIQIIKSLGEEFANLNEEGGIEEGERLSLPVEENLSINIQEEDRSIDGQRSEQSVSIQDEEGLQTEREISSVITPIKRKKHRPNLLLEPVFTDTRNVIIYNAVKIALGVGATIFNNTYLDPNDKAYPLCNTFGYLLIGSGVGEVGMEGLSRLLKKVEDFFNSAPTQVSHPRATKIGLKAMKLAVEAVPLLFVELNMVYEIFNEQKNYLGLPLGIAYGMTKQPKKREFQELTRTIEKERKKNNMVPQAGCWEKWKDSQVFKALDLVDGDRRLRTAIIVDRVISIPLYLGLTAFTIAVAVDADSIQDQIAISALLVSTFGVTGLATLLKKLFKPGKNSRLFNEVYFNFFENKEFLPLIYSFLTQMSNIDDESIAKDTKLQFAFALLGMTTFGAMLGLDRFEAGDSSRDQVLHTDPGYRMSSWLTFIMLLKGK